jgi:hypothetical protein
MAYIEANDPENAAKIRAAAPPEALRAIDETPDMGWIPIEYDYAVYGTAWGTIVSEEKALEYCRGAVQAVLVSPLLRSLLEFVLRLASASPAPALKVFPRGWEQVWRDCCDIDLQFTPSGSAEIILSDMADIYAKYFPGYHLSWQATMESLCALSNHDCEVEFEDDLRVGRSVIRVRWRPR